MTVLKDDLPNADAYARLFETTGWNESYQADGMELHDGIRSSWYTISAYQNGDLIGFGRLISDGALYAFICDMIVDPGHQGRGIGRQLMEAMLTRCREAGIRVVWLMAARGKAGFYQKHGFEPRPEDGPGMQLNLNLRT